jgi:hypothetical protein
MSIALLVLIHAVVQSAPDELNASLIGVNDKFQFGIKREGSRVAFPLTLQFASFERSTKLRAAILKACSKSYGKVIIKPLVIRKDGRYGDVWVPLGKVDPGHTSSTTQSLSYILIRKGFALYRGGATPVELSDGFAGAQHLAENEHLGIWAK